MSRTVRILVSLLAARGAAAAAAATTTTSTTPGRKCRDLTVPVTISAENSVFSLQPPTTEIDVANFVLNYGREGHYYQQELRTGSATVSGTFKIAATYCEPAGATRPDTVQVLTHGAAFDRGYWDAPSINGRDYSYVRAALEAGYATFSYDRLGIAGSAVPGADPVNQIQAPLEAAAMVSMLKSLRSGSGIPGLEGKPFKHVVGVGHSFGSLQTFLASAQGGKELLDVVVLTGFATRATNPGFNWAFQYGAGWLPAPKSLGLSPGFIVGGTQRGLHVDFFAPGNFDPAVLKYAFTKLVRPVAVGELLGVSGRGVNQYSGPVLAITGNRDVPFCGGDCLASGDPSTGGMLNLTKQDFPNATPFLPVIVPDSGHALNLEYTAPLTYSTIFNFIKAHL